VKYLYVTLLLLVSTSCERLSLARPWSTTPLPLSLTFASFWCQWAPSLRRHSTNGQPKSAPWRIFALAIFHPGLKTKKVNIPSSCASPRAEQSSHSSFYAQPQVQGLFTTMLPHPPTIFIASRHVSVPTISFPSGGHRHCKLFTNRLPLYYNCRIQCRGERSIPP
jgi:hypothetical protein